MVIVDFSAKEISSDGAIVLLEKIERGNKLLDYFSAFIPDNRSPLTTIHTTRNFLSNAFSCSCKAMRTPILSISAFDKTPIKELLANFQINQNVKELQLNLFTDNC